MAATLKLDYAQVYGLVMQLTLDQQQMLRNDLDAKFEEPKHTLRPYTIEEVQGFVREAEADIKAGRVCTAEEGMRKIDEKFPWLCN